jgi:hypothetical protein
MIHPFRLRALLLAGVFALPGGAWAGELTLTRVMLSSGGVAYVEFAGSADGGPLGLDVPLDQVDDVLKSLVVFDAAGGVGGFSLPGKDSSHEAFGDVPIGPQALASPVDFLNGLRGVTVEVKGPSPMSGRIMRAERVPELAAGKEAAIERTRVTLMTDAGMRQFVLEDAEAVQVADPVLRGKIGRALEALRRDSARTVRHITLAAPAAGTHGLRVGYVVGAPLWKVSYRVVLPADDAPRARLQGWAVLENTTGADWKDVEVALQYGNPVTFRQALYATYFVQRPEVPVEVLGRILPRVDTRARSTQEFAGAPPPPPAPAGVARGMRAPMAEMAAKAAPPVMAAPAEAAAASEGAQETVFVLPGKVSLAAGHTASLPILDREVKAARIGLVQQGRPHPLASIRLTNDTATSLPAGVLTLYDPASPAMFAGDARLGGLPAGESRLLSFAEDLRTETAWAHEEASSIAGVTAAKGVLRIDERLRYTSKVTLTAPAREARELLVEIGKPGGATLVAGGPAPAEETATAWRFRVALKAGEVRELAVQSERITQRQVALLHDEATALRLIGTPEVSPGVKAALQRLEQLRAAKAAREAEVKRLEAQYAGIERDEERIRRNIAAVPSNDALRGRLVRQLEALENRVDGLNQQSEQAKAAMEQAQKALEDAIANFSI